MRPYRLKLAAKSFVNVIVNVNVRRLLQHRKLSIDLAENSHFLQKP
jgi:hypothetical protein